MDPASTFAAAAAALHPDLETLAQIMKQDKRIESQWPADKLAIRHFPATHESSSPLAEKLAEKLTLATGQS
jgi:hypothetical protein